MSANASSHQLLAETFVNSTLGLATGSAPDQRITEVTDNAPSQGKRDIRYSMGTIIAFPTSRATRSELSRDQRVKARDTCPINQKTKKGRCITEPLLWPVTLGKPSIRWFITTTWCDTEARSEPNIRMKMVAVRTPFLGLAPIDQVPA